MIEQGVPGEKAAGIELQIADHHMEIGVFLGCKQMGEVFVGTEISLAAESHMSRVKMYCSLCCAQGKRAIRKVRRVQSHERLE